VFLPRDTSGVRLIQAEYEPYSNRIRMCSTYSNRIAQRTFRYTRRITTKHVTSLRCPTLRHSDSSIRVDVEAVCKNMLLYLINGVPLEHLRRICLLIVLSEFL